MAADDPQRRSAHAQIQAMRKHWPDFEGRKLANGALVWRGPLKPKAQLYIVSIFWMRGAHLPYVVVDGPPIRPRANGNFASIPHLIYYEAQPELSGLCLFDPAGNEWSECDLIAETTVWWAAEWLLYYELWHLTGEWLAPAVGDENVARVPIDDARAIRETLADVH